MHSLTPLAQHGPLLSPIVAGVWRMADWKWNAQERLRWIEGAAAMGVTSFDHADIYGGYTVEGLFGEALALAPSLRAQLQLVSKCGIRLKNAARPTHRIKHYDSSALHITQSVDASLRELRTDYLDVLLLHRPDPLMEAEEVARAFDMLRASGKVRHFGVSNFTPSQVELLVSRTLLTTNQIELHPLHRAPLTDGTLDQCQQRGMRPMIWSPLAGGQLLTGTSDDAVRVRAALDEIGHARGVSAATIAYAWLLRLPSRPIPIAGSRRLEALAEGVAALDVVLDAQEWTQIWKAGAGRDVP